MKYMEHPLQVWYLDQSKPKSERSMLWLVHMPTLKGVSKLILKYLRIYKEMTEFYVKNTFHPT